MNEEVKEFFQWSDLFDYMVTKQLSHIRSNWELMWNHDEERYEPEEDSYAEMINDLVVELRALCQPSGSALKRSIGVRSFIMTNVDDLLIVRLE